MAAPEKEPMEELTPEVQLLALAALTKQIKKVDGPLRAEVGFRFRNGQGETFRSPVDGKKLGQVRRNDPDPVWTITNREQLRAHLAANGGELTTVTADPERAAEVLAVLADHAPHLIVEHTAVPDAALDWALHESSTSGTAVAPGIELVEQHGSLVVTVDRTTGVTAAADMARAGLVDWSTRPELDAGR